MIPDPPNPRTAHTGRGVDLAGIPRGPEFIALGRCAETDGEVFFPEQGGTPRDALRICGACEVRDECLTWAMETSQMYGIWGGTTARQRQKMRNAS